MTEEEQGNSEEQVADQGAGSGTGDGRRRSTRRPAESSDAEAAPPEPTPAVARRRRSRAANEDQPPETAATEEQPVDAPPAPRRRRAAPVAEQPQTDEPSPDEPAAEAVSGDEPAAEAAPPARRRRRTSQPTEEQVPEPSTDGDEVPQPEPARRRRAARQPAPEADEVAALTVRSAPRLLERLRSEIGPALMQEYGYSSRMEVPRLSKVVLNIGLGEALTNARALESASRDINLISGQRPVTTRARRSIAGFKIREGMAVGLSVTLRGRRMYEFVDRLISSALPRIRDFRGLSRESFDGRGNYSLGIREQVIFPEIDYNSIDRLRGLQVNIGTTARNDLEGLRLLELMGMPFTRRPEAERVA